MRSVGIAIAACVCALGLGIPDAVSGPLDPPPGPPTPTNRVVLSAQLISLPYVIDAPGSYVLHSNLTAPADTPAVVIASDDVTLDLNGFLIEGGGGKALTNGVEVLFDDKNVVPFINVTIRNGSIRGFSGDGILSNGEQVLVEDIHVSDNMGYGVRVANASVISRCTARNNSEVGLFGHLTTIVECIAISNGVSGIKTVGGTIQDCSASLNLGDGFRAFDGSTISNCSAFSNAVGINAVDGSAVIDCAAFTNTQTGIVAYGGSSVIDCSLRNNSVCGVDADFGGTIRGNTFSANPISIRVNEGNVVTENNVQTSQGDAGVLAIGSGNRIDANTFANNDTAIETTTGGNLITRNTFWLNVTNFDLAAGNSLGPIVDVTGAGDVTMIFNANHPLANLIH